MDDNLQDFKESMNAWGWSVNARNNFNKFIDAAEYNTYKKSNERKCR